MFTGSRDLYISRSVIIAALDNSGSMKRPAQIIVGDALGVDWCVRNWAVHNGYELGKDLLVYRADWGKYGGRAGPLRNQEMAEQASGGRCIFFIEDNVWTPGTSDAMVRADDQGCTVTGVFTEVIKVKPDVKVAVDISGYRF